ncbi:D-2-hydroxyacid dehydrogenase family protein [Roseomonas populi]|uniref:D-2-hydroxyacid dehydrogenase family protein n=1 Tax=Roseomonas populi TaxID=3121582 RepID=A0ABT1XBL8_9PROT|nr:D-2-hydroxyacid dehydrogenase family protein [Roseomonas pecuniae]MCR0985141.1 D-2-hydroxyacid dehydrogenase family protein [Roseomonas pecuniae]
MALRRIAVLDDFGGAAPGAADWSGLPVTFFTDHVFDEAALAERLAGYDAVVLIRERTPFPASLIARLPDLRLVVTTGAKNRTLDLGVLAARGIAACGTRSLEAPTVEMTWALILSLARRVPFEDAALRAGHWQTGPGRSLQGATLGVVGLGKLGRQVAALGRAFGMEVIAWSANLTEEAAAAAGARRVEKDALFRAADIVTLHLVLGDRSRNTVGTAELAAMKPGALLVNTARAGLVDQAALIAALESGHLGGAAIDVHEIEPMPPGHPLLGAPRTILTPHLGYVTAENYRLYFEGVTEALHAFNAGRPLPNPLTPQPQAA